MNPHAVINFALAGIVIIMSIADLLVTVRWEKRWRKRLQESSEQTINLFSEKAALELELDRKENSIRKLEEDLNEAKEKLKKAHEKVACLMVEYDRLTKIAKRK